MHNYELVIVTNLAAFYKINLYNEISKAIELKVFFVSNKSEIRDSDFMSDNILFDYEYLNCSNIEDRNSIKSSLKLINKLKQIQFKKILIGGWDLLEYWLVAFSFPKSKLMLTLESTVLESTRKGLKGLIKRKFLNRMGSCYASGNEHQKLLESLNFKGQTILTRGVGLINKTDSVFKAKTEYNMKYLYVGRLSEEKNLEWLITQFAGRKESLTIVGYGPLEKSLKKMAGPNIHFAGAVDNQELREYYESHSFLILPSLSETWGLVVEESLYFGTPVILSDRCGAKELINNKNGYIINTDKDDLTTILNHMDSNTYLALDLAHLRTLLIEKDLRQVQVYI